MRGLHFFALAVLVLLLYVNILPNPFVWDDNIFILQNQFIRDWKNIPLLFQSEFFSKSDSESTFQEGGYYRPLVMVLYTLEYHLWGESPLGYHLISIFLHLFNVILVYFLIQSLFQNKNIALVGSLLFASHPLHVETVSYLASRGDLLTTLFCLASFLLSLSPRRVERGISLLLFVMALLSKESAMIFPALLFVFALCNSVRKDRRARITHAALHGFILFVYVMLRFLFFPFRLTRLGTEGPGFLLRVFSLGKLIVSYVALLIFPHPLYLERTAPLQMGFWEGGTVVLIGVVAGAVTLGKFFWRKDRSLFFGMAWFLIALIPVSNMIPLYPSMAEHYLYFPSIGFFATLSYYLVRLFVRAEKRGFRKILLFLGVSALAFYGAVVTRRNQDYSDEKRLFLQTITHSPQSAAMHNNLGAVYMAHGFLEKAADEFEKTLSLNPRFPMVFANLGSVYRERGEYDKAIVLFKKALAHEKGQAEIWNKLGIAYAEKGRKEAVAAFAQAIQENPAFGDAYFNLGAYYWREGEFEKASFFWKEGLKRDPSHPALKRWLPLLKEVMSQEK